MTLMTLKSSRMTKVVNVASGYNTAAAFDYNNFAKSCEVVF